MLAGTTHVASRDPTLDAVGTRSCAIRRGMPKKRATAIFDLSLRVSPSEVAPATEGIEEDLNVQILLALFCFVQIWRRQ